ncbi:ribosomal protein S18-alanine N-acetyltransferase [Arcanobacterium hippocoleae]|uniref:ribosomal protein S18-alanine N-acetyltransferase n=1 Tax=Arcanobacterium hippocoleae TaxID=149017 RepID=UPI00333F68DC
MRNLQEVEFQRLTPAWAKRCANFDAQNFAVDAWPEAVWQNELRRTDCVYLALLNPPEPHQSLGEIIALGGVSFGIEAEILTIAVAAHLRRRGIAQALLAQLIEIAQAHQAADLFLEVRAADFGAQALYRNAGFSEVGLRKNYYRHDDALVMQKKLCKECEI